jgi:hypothetical protein
VPICSSGPARISGLRDPGGLRLSNHGNAPPSSLRRTYVVQECVRRVLCRTLAAVV